MSDSPSIQASKAASGLRFVEAFAGYGAGDVLSALNLTVGAGEFVGVVGPNGAGKSTLLRTVTAEAELSSGRVDVCGSPLADLGTRERARLVGVVPQALPVLFAFSAREFVEMGRHARLGRFDHPGPNDEAAVERALELTDTAKLAEERVDTLSGGDLQRLTLAQALAQEPRLLLLDEATSHLDLNHRLQVLDLCRGLASQGMAVLGVFHDLELAARYSDRIAVVSGGSLIEEGPPAKVLRPDLLRDVFRVRAVVGRDAATGAVTVTPLLRDEDVSPQCRGRVLVIGGSGNGAWLLSTLVRSGWDVRLAAVSVGDTDHDVARVLGVPSIELAPFGEMTESDEAQVRAEADAADAVIVSATPFGRANVANLRAAVGAGVLVLVGTMGEERDFTGGEARRLWEHAVAAGARIADSEADTVRILGEVV